MIFNTPCPQPISHKPSTFGMKFDETGTHPSPTTLHQGTYQFDDGSKYEGEFEHGWMHGKGKYIGLRPCTLTLGIQPRIG